MPPPILSFENLGLVQGEGWLFRHLDIHVGPRDRLALIGRNGAGKTTLLKCLANIVDTDEGKRSIVPGTKVVLLEQNPVMTGHDTLEQWVLAGDDAPQPHDAAAIADQIGIDLSAPTATASGGERRRAAIVRALAQDPDVLLLDEPTNHLDLAAIEWLEQWLARFKGAFIVISHDRTFLARLTKSCLWLDRGTVRRAEIGFGGFDAWTDAVYAEEARAADKLDAKLKIELHWLERGVTGRRRRNQGRLAKLNQMRATRAAMLGGPGTAALALGRDDVKTKVVIDAEHVTKSFTTELGEQRTIIRDFTLRIQRGDRIGIVGSNGTGKTTLLKLLTGELLPDEGKVKLAKTLSGIVIDQQRRLMDPGRTVREVLAEGGDWIDVRGEKKHIKGYLKEFLFAPELSEAPIASLSGGERSRLLLAREFARESNLLVLDEPTNDLDLETLDLLQQVIADYDGTVLIVSHDRDFLDRTVTVTLGLDGSGKVDIVAGGYEDWVRQRNPSRNDRQGKRPPAVFGQAGGLTDLPMGDRAKRGGGASPPAPPLRQPNGLPPPRSGEDRRKLSFKDQRDLDRLPAEVTRLDRDIAEAEKALHDPDLYTSNPTKFAALTKTIDTKRAEKEAAEVRWLEVAGMAEELGR
ncbi:ABC-F family ATP-binding cassette domain-containing protein [Sphingomonas sp.]|uniref:ABC-F family ATP-binding cassette domain-containing protein n=1 Tax=Sphingomonas sp. TaxID=28214 RepID=UPI00286B921F|nr:ABC-F family ATP-binding cassette domain-containing protein [Sphingomonas sp.]